MISEKLKEVEENIAKACEKAGRNREEVTLIAVSKTKPVEMLKEAYDLGIRDFGENKVQELVDKYEKLPKDIRWHMIGHLQRNKVKYIIDKVVLIHSVDSIELAKEISKQAVKHNITANILIEVNIAGEESKFGVQPQDAVSLAVEIISLPNIAVRGVMCIAPFVANCEENRKYFQNLCKLDVDISKKISNNTEVNIISMGMTNDYPVAVEEGSTMVRVGTGIFGERNYNI
ncbi:MAG: YggS family pyridoxal phosphate-dependent enzyme [Lachnospiraceae bacterium]|nr:YggS family pyridoxal phosphate-dependent enzyme [Lachnospiraceae bacterium]